jgi:3-oxoadipate enol-lactonase
VFAELTDLRCYYQLLGAGDPVLLVPGLGATCALWDSIAAELSNSFSLILPDTRGLGRSIPKRAPQTLADFAVDLVELMDHLQLDRVHVLGLSLGGMIAQQLAIDHPSRVDRLVLVSCANRFVPYLREVAMLLAQALRHFPPNAFRRTMELLGTAPQYFDDHATEIEQKIAQSCEVSIPRSAVARQLRCLARSESHHANNHLINAPTLVIAGDQDMLIPACYAQQMAAAIPGSEFVLMPGSGHNPFMEKPDVVIPLVTEFLMRARAADSHPGTEDAKLAMEATV